MLFAGSLVAQKESFVPATNVSFTVAAESKTYPAGQPVQLKYRIENRSETALYVPREFQSTACFDPAHPGPHISGDFVSAAGHHSGGGWGISCGSAPGWSPSMSERMPHMAILLHPGEHTDGIYEMDPALFKLPAGDYRVEISLRGWDAAQFSAEQLTDLQAMGPLLAGEVLASAEITLVAPKR